MAFLPTTFERKWPTIILTPIAVANYVITVSDTIGLHTKQKITLRLAGNAENFEIKKVLSDTQIQVGPEGSDMAKLSNPIAFNGGTLTMSEQNRNPMGWEIVGRAVYEEEPAVALRTLSVNKYGTPIDTVKDNNGLNRLAVDADINVGNLSVDISYPTTPMVITVPMATANTEYAIVIPAKTYNFSIRERDAKGAIKLRDTAGGVHYTIPRGNGYNSGPIDRPSALTMYAESATAGLLLEVLAWVYP